MTIQFKDFLIREANQQRARDRTGRGAKTDWGNDLFGNMGLGDDNLPAPVFPPPAEPVTPKRHPKPVSGETTRQKLKGITASPAASNMLTRAVMSGTDSISDDQARINAGVASRATNRQRTQTPVGTPDETANLPIPTTTKNLPKVITRALVNSKVEPEWHAVKHLPGYLSSGIRSMGRSLFSAFTAVPIEDIQVLANLQDSGPNDQRELDAVLVLLQQQGIRRNDIELEFQEKIPGYTAQVRAYTAMGYTFITVKDEMGKYIYSWASDEADLDKLQISSPADATSVGYSAPRLPRR